MRTSRAEWITGQLDFKGSPDLKSGYLKQLISRYHQVFSNAKTKQRIIRNCAQVSLQALGNRFSEVGQILLYPSFEQKADNAWLTPEICDPDLSDEPCNSDNFKESPESYLLCRLHCLKTPKTRKEMQISCWWSLLRRASLTTAMLPNWNKNRLLIVLFSVRTSWINTPTIISVSMLL